MTNPIQLLRDYRKWRKERLDKEYQHILMTIAKEIALIEAPSDMQIDKSTVRLVAKALSYGIEHHKEILKQVKI